MGNNTFTPPKIESADSLAGGGVAADVLTAKAAARPNIVYLKYNPVCVGIPNMFATIPFRFFSLKNLHLNNNLHLNLCEISY